MVSTSRGAGSRKSKPTSDAPPKSSRLPVVAEAARAAGADRQRAEALLELIERRKESIAEDFYDLGEALRELQRKRLHVALGHASFAEMLRARRIMGLTQAKKLIEVAQALPRGKALELGPEKAYALARYAAATPEIDTARSLLEGGARIDDKPIEELSVRELTRAIGKVKAKVRRSKPVPAEEREALQAARRLQAWLRARGARDAIAVARKDKGGFSLHVELRVEVVDELIGE
ncbi:MAG: hypothetical protein IT372_37025 [Polyangiaceae bacterium]|nr:hypothetical protein [Polyangiaceae bacterium]